MQIATVPSLNQITAIIAAIGALGTAAFGLVDSLKALPGGGISRAGFKFIRQAVLKLAPQVAALDETGLSVASMLYTLESQWINGAATADQVNIAKSLIKLRLTPETAPVMGKATGVDADVLTQVAANIRSGNPLSVPQSDVYGRFDLLLSTLLDQAYQRADQRYRNASKFAAIPISVALAFCGVMYSPVVIDHKYRLAIVVGLIATPIAPIAKDISTAITTGVQAMQAWEGLTAMAHWFLSTRAQSIGGPVAPVTVLDADRPGHPYDLTGELVDAVRGREIFFGVHGFNVHQAEGIKHLGYWFDRLQIGNAVPVGILWPGDCIVPIFIDYVVEGREAIESGKLLAEFLNTNLTGAVSLCFASHSLGARVVLQTVDGLSQAFRIRRTLLMAGAIDDDCLTDEYSAAAGKLDEISILASTCDDVLALAYPLGNPLQGIIDRGHPYYHEALGREGPAEPNLLSSRLHPDWQIPESLDYGHLDYLPGQPIQDAFLLPLGIPPDNGPNPPVIPPPTFVDPDHFKPAWSAAFASSRYR